MAASHENANFIPNIVSKLKVESLYNCLQKEVNGIDYYKNTKDHKSSETPITQPQQKLIRDLHTKFSQDQYEASKKLEGYCSKPYEGLKIVELKVDLCYDIHITLKFTIENYEHDPENQAAYDEEDVSLQNQDTKIINKFVFWQMVES